MMLHLLWRAIAKTLSTQIHKHQLLVFRKKNFVFHPILSGYLPCRESWKKYKLKWKSRVSKLVGAATSKHRKPPTSAKDSNWARSMFVGQLSITRTHSSRCTLVRPRYPARVGQNSNNWTDQTPDHNFSSDKSKSTVRKLLNLSNIGPSGTSKWASPHQT